MLPLLRSFRVPAALCVCALRGNAAPAVQTLDLAGEALLADDITIEAYHVDYQHDRGPWSLSLGLGSNRYGLDYVNTLFASSARLEESTWLADLAATRRWGTHAEATLGVRAYDGVADYRSLWLAEYYRETWFAFPAYRAPDPGGEAVNLSTTWHYAPGAGSLEAALDLGRDRVVPAWSFDPFLGLPVSSREELNTVTGLVRWEQALNGWLKTTLAVTHRTTSERDSRVGLDHSWAASAGPVALRLSGGYAEEAPTFDSTYGGAALEWRFQPSWTLTTRYRVYRDSGEIAESTFTASAPALDSQETSVGLLWERPTVDLSVSVGWLDTDYAPLTTENSFFGALYRDRDWVHLRAAATFRF